MLPQGDGGKLHWLMTEGDNGEEYTSREFKEHLNQHGIRHSKNPEQNGTAEWINHTHIESVRSMLALPKQFWALHCSVLQDRQH